MSEIDDITAIVQALQVVFPHLFPKEDRERKALIAVWFNDLGHFPLPLLKDAAQYLRSHEDFPTIAAMFRSIRAVSDIPTKRDVEAAIEKMLEQRDSNGSYTLKGLHPLARTVFRAMGEYSGMTNRDPTSHDIAFTREYNLAAQEWFDEACKPDNVHLLAKSESPQLEGAKP